jgi:hypothetical protein
VIDVMILYTKKAASRYLRDPADLLEMATEQANQAFRNSGSATSACGSCTPR